MRRVPCPYRGRPPGARFAANAFKNALFGSVLIRWRVLQLGSKGNTAGSKVRGPGVANANGTNLAPLAGGQPTWCVQVGGRLDIKKEISEINFVASLTDSTIRGYESAPHLPDAIVTADKKINSEPLSTCGPRSRPSEHVARMTRHTHPCRWAHGDGILIV